MAKEKKSKKKSGILLYADSNSSADMYYFGGVFVPDPFIAMGVGKKKIAVVGALEFSRVKKESYFDEVLSLEDYREEATLWFKNTSPSIAEVICVVAKKYGVGEVVVPKDFHAETAFQLKELGLGVKFPGGALFPKREVKSEAEAKAIAQGNKGSAAGIKAAEDALKRSTIKGNKLYLDGKVLTSERLRAIVDIACLDVGARASSTIVAGGDQACDPHCIGHGPLKANELIIVDVFPRIESTGYHGDMTRTFLKGKATEAQKKLVHAVQGAQKAALSKVKAGVNGSSVHKAVQDYFEVNDYKTEKKGDVHQGFFHGTGHGLGLEVHELPRVGGAGQVLKDGVVVTIEPGLYYPGLGGCRIEDVVWVNKKGYKMLSNYHYRWQLK